MTETLRLSRSIPGVASCTTIQSLSVARQKAKAPRCIPLHGEVSPSCWV